MPAHFDLRLDTTAPQGAVFELAGGSNILPGSDADPLPVAVTLTTTDPDTTGYQIKLWGDVDPDFSPDIGADEVSSAWVDYGTIATVELTAGAGLKTVHAKIRDDVGNETATLTDDLTVDTTVPAVTITIDPDRIKISKVAPWDVSSFTFAADSDIDRYEIRVVPDPGATHDQGMLYVGVDGAEAAMTPIAENVNGTNLQALVGPDGDYVIKVFAREALTGFWSV